MKTNKNQINCKIITAFSIAIVITCTVQSLTAQPVINSFSPTAGVIGTTVTIKGKNFNPEAEKNTVYFGAVKAAVSNVTDSSLNVVVPIGATYQPITITADSLTALQNIHFL